MESWKQTTIVGLVAIISVLCLTQSGCSERECDCSDVIVSAIKAERVSGAVIIKDLTAQIAKFKSDQEAASVDVKAGEECVRERLAAVNAEVETANAEEDSKFVENMRAALGMPPVETEKSAMTFIPAEELLAKKPVKCLFVASWNVPAFYDHNGVVWNGVSYDGGYYPVLETLPNGMIKTVEQRKAPEGKFTVIYFPKEAMAKDWRKTEWGQQEGNYDIDSDVPELCPIPKDAKKKPTGGASGVKS